MYIIHFILWSMNIAYPSISLSGVTSLCLGACMCAACPSDMERPLVQGPSHPSHQCCAQAHREGEEWGDHQHTPRQWCHQLLRSVLGGGGYVTLVERAGVIWLALLRVINILLKINCSQCLKSCTNCFLG